MRLISLDARHAAIVDDADYARLSRWKWCVSRMRGGRLYAVRGVKSGGKSKTVLMHRWIINAPDGVGVDHVNGCGLDNRRENLRLADQHQNTANASKHRDAKGSRFKGVSRHRSGNAFYAEICVRGRRIRKGGFKTEEGAAHQYDTWATQYFGEFARPNFPKEAA